MCNSCASVSKYFNIYFWTVVVDFFVITVYNRVLVVQCHILISWYIFHIYNMSMTREWWRPQWIPKWERNLSEPQRFILEKHSCKSVLTLQESTRSAYLLCDCWCSFFFQVLSRYRYWSNDDKVSSHQPTSCVTTYSMFARSTFHLYKQTMRLFRFNRSHDKPAKADTEK